MQKTYEGLASIGNENGGLRGNEGAPNHEAQGRSRRAVDAAHVGSC